MLKINLKHFLFLAVFGIFFQFHAPTAQAALELNITPVDGGNTIRFNRGDINSGVTKEVRVRITTNDNTQYQVYQQLVSSFVNERGITIDRPVLLASIVPGSNGSGTPYLSSYEPMGRGEQLLYTSSPQGMSEAFTIVYTVDPKYLSDSGSFRGLIQFSLRPVTGGQRETIQTNVFIESNADLQVKVAGSTAVNLVRLDTSMNAIPAYVNLSFSGNSGGNVKVYQEVLTYPINDLNFELDSDILKTTFEGAVNGDLSYPSTIDLPRNRVLIYKSTQQSDSFSIRFLIPPDNLVKLMAGGYRGVIRFSFETDHDVKNFDINLDIKIAPIFEIKLDFPQGPINFTGIFPGKDPQIKEVDVQVRTNLHRPYVVNQKVSDLLVNDKGQIIPEKFFVVKEVLLSGNSGRPASEEYVPVKQGEEGIFYSDKNGSPATFKVLYRLSPFEGINPGDYKTAILYSLGEL